jgi:hypothetical protein
VALTTAKAFEDFLADRLEPMKTEKSLIDGRPKSVSSYLSKAFPGDSDMPLHSTTLMGSCAKGTAIHAVDDVDVLAVFGNAQAVYDKYRFDSRKFLYRVKQALDGYQVQVVGARGQAVRLFYQSGPYADITPVLPVSGGGYYLPAGDGSWVRTDPDADIRWFNSEHARLGYHLKPLVKLIKAWNRAHSRHLRSFHLEVMVAKSFSSLGANYREALEMWFASPNFSVAAPSTGESLDTYVSIFSERRRLLNAVLTSSADRAKRARASEAVGDHREAIRLWGLILGDGFPAYG